MLKSSHYETSAFGFFTRGFMLTACLFFFCGVALRPDAARACSLATQWYNEDMVANGILGLYGDLKTCARNAKAKEFNLVIKIVNGAMSRVNPLPEPEKSCVDSLIDRFRIYGVLNEHVAAEITLSPMNPKRQYALRVTSRHGVKTFTHETKLTRLNTYREGVQLSLAKIGSKPVVQYKVPPDVVGKKIVLRSCTSDEKIPAEFRGHLVAGSIQQKSWCEKPQPSLGDKDECDKPFMDCVSSSCAEVEEIVKEESGVFAKTALSEFHEYHHDYVAYIPVESLRSPVLTFEQISQVRKPVRIDLDLIECGKESLDWAVSVIGNEVTLHRFKKCPKETWRLSFGCGDQSRSHVITAARGDALSKIKVPGKDVLDGCRAQAQRN